MQSCNVNLFLYNFGDVVCDRVQSDSWDILNTRHVPLLFFPGDSHLPSQQRDTNSIS